MLNQTQKFLCDLCANMMFSKEITPPEKFNKAELLDEAKKQTVFPITYTALKKLGIIDENAQKKYYSYIATNIRVSYAHSEICNILSENSISYVVLKGVASAKYYKESTLRMMGDVDVLVHESDVNKVDSALSEHGFFTKDNVFNIDNHVAYTRVANGVKTKCEVHINVNGAPQEIKDIFNGYMEDIIEKSTEICVGDGKCFVPSEFHNGMVLIMHTANHLTNEGIGLRHFCDWALFVNNFSNEEFINLFEIPFKKIGLWRFAQLITLCCIKYLGVNYKEWAGKTDDDILEGIITDVFSCGNFGAKDISRHFQIKYIKNRKTGKISDKKGFRQKLSIINEKAKKQYSFAEKHKSLLVFAWIAVLFKYLYLILKGERKFDSFDTINKADNRKNLYNKFKLFETDN